MTDLMHHRPDAPRPSDRESKEGVEDDLLFSPTLEQLLARPGWDIVHRVAVPRMRGSGARRVRIALTAEICDPGRFLRGNELVLTTGAKWRSPSDAVTFLHSVARAGSTAVGVGVGPWLPTVPEALVFAARKAAVDLLEVPADVPFLEIAERVSALRRRSRGVWSRHRSWGLLLELARRGTVPLDVLEAEMPALRRAGGAVVAACIRTLRRLPADGLLVVGHCAEYSYLVGAPDDVDAELRAQQIHIYGRGPTVTLSGLARSLAESVQGLDVAEERGSAVLSQDLATLDALVSRLSTDQLAPFRNTILVPLREHDRFHPGDLVATARALVTADGSVSAAARVLHVHPNTLRKRVHRIAELTGTDGASAAGLAALRLALAGEG